MTSQKDFLGQIVKALDDAGIPYMLSGSIGSSFHGYPRSTNDADIVIAPTPEQLIDFVDSLGRCYYVNKETALEALRNNLMFNVIDTEAGWKADIIIRKERPYSKKEFSRRTNAVVMGIDLSILSAEDSILSKLEWSKGRESQAQFDDALNVLTVQWNRLDFDYLKKWAKELGVEDALEQLFKKAGDLKKQD